MTLEELINKKGPYMQEWDENRPLREIEMRIIKEGDKYVIHEFIEGVDTGPYYKMHPSFFKKAMEDYKEGKATLEMMWDLFKDYFLMEYEPTYRNKNKTLYQ